MIVREFFGGVFGDFLERMAERERGLAGHLWEMEGRG